MGDLSRIHWKYSGEHSPCYNHTEPYQVIDKAQILYIQIMAHAVFNKSQDKNISLSWNCNQKAAKLVL